MKYDVHDIYNYTRHIRCRSLEHFKRARKGKIEVFSYSFAVFVYRNELKWPPSNGGWGWGVVWKGEFSIFFFEYRIRESTAMTTKVALIGSLSANRFGVNIVNYTFAVNSLLTNGKTKVQGDGRRV